MKNPLKLNTCFLYITEKCSMTVNEPAWSRITKCHRPSTLREINFLVILDTEKSLAKTRHNLSTCMIPLKIRRSFLHGLIILNGTLRARWWGRIQVDKEWETCLHDFWVSGYIWPDATCGLLEKYLDNTRVCRTYNLSFPGRKYCDFEAFAFVLKHVTFLPWVLAFWYVLLYIKFT